MGGSRYSAAAREPRFDPLLKGSGAPLRCHRLAAIISSLPRLHARNRRALVPAGDQVLAAGAIEFSSAWPAWMRRVFSMATATALWNVSWVIHAM